MNILCITHADFETPGIITPWAHKNGYKLHVKKPYQDEQLPDIDNFDILIIMGGPQSATQLDKYPYLRDEVTLIQQALIKNKKIIGFCLGAQLIGAAFGADAMRSPEKEIGIHSITLTEQGMSDVLLQELPNSFPVIHWHNDMPGLSNDATVLATSIGCPRQIVRYQPLVYGFQCHLEIDSHGIKDLVNACPEDLTPTLFTQNKEQLFEQSYHSINETMRILLDRFVQLK